MAYNDKGNNILVTSGYNFEGYSIVEYLGFYSGECALGTGFLSSLGAGFADFLGTNSEMYSGKLKKAKDYAIQELQQTVASVGGNAIIGFDIDYSTFSSDIMGVVANGTAVKIVKNQSKNTGLNDEKEISVKQTNIKKPIRPVTFYAQPLAENTKISIGIMTTERDCEIAGIMADIEIRTIFEETFEITGLYFVNFKEETLFHFRSGFTDCDIDPAVLDRISSVSVLIRKYINKDSVVDIPKDSMDLQDNVPDTVSVDNLNESNVLEVAKSFSTAREITNYLRENVSDIDPALLEQLEEIANTERMYGNMKKSAIKKIENYFGTETES